MTAMTTIPDVDSYLSRDDDSSGDDQSWALSHAIHWQSSALRHGIGNSGTFPCCIKTYHHYHHHMES